MERSGLGDATGPPCHSADLRWGLAARGALVDAGGPPNRSRVGRPDHVWLTSPLSSTPPQPPPSGPRDRRRLVGGSDTTRRGRARSGGTDDLPRRERRAALIIPARLLSRIHPHFREVMQLLATQAADEARHVEVFSRRGLLSGGPLGTSSASGGASLQTLLTEPDFTTASFLLSVLGEGTFLDLLRFLTGTPQIPYSDVTRLALRDEARHVASGWPTPRTRPAPTERTSVRSGRLSSVGTLPCSTPPGLIARYLTRWCCCGGSVETRSHQPWLASGAGAEADDGRGPPSPPCVRRVPGRRSR